MPVEQGLPWHPVATELPPPPPPKKQTRNPNFPRWRTEGKLETGMNLHWRRTGGGVGDGWGLGWRRDWGRGGGEHGGGWSTPMRPLFVFHWLACCTLSSGGQWLFGWQALLVVCGFTASVEQTFCWCVSTPPRAWGMSPTSKTKDVAPVCTVQLQQLGALALLLVSDLLSLRLSDSLPKAALPKKMGERGGGMLRWGDMGHHHKCIV